MFLTEKQDGTIKAWQCVNGRKQWQYADKEKATSPSVMTEAIFLTSMMEETER